jgi:hypothetical protein
MGIRKTVAIASLFVFLHNVIVCVNMKNDIAA